MRVLYFTERDSPHDRRFLSALAGTSHQVYALRQFECQPQTPSSITELGWPDRQPDWSAWQGWQHGKDQLSEILAEVQPDLVHAGPVQGPALLTALVGFHPLVTMSWGSDLLVTAKRSSWMRLATRYTLERTDVFLGDCQTVADEAARYGFPRDKMVLFPWGVDLNHFSLETGRMAGELLRQSLGWEDKFVMLCNRSWSPLYGVDILAEAFVDAASENPDLRLLLVGDGPQSDLIHRTLSPVREKVRFPGILEREALPGVYCAADLVVSPSHSDGSSISLLEALACGRPVLVSDIPGNREWVTPGEVGELFRDGEVASLQAMLIQMSNDPDLDLYGHKARAVAERRADWDQNFQKLLGAYHRAVE
jgi:glycosyltransferase involved in cell wall biosynthesis